MSHNSPSPSSQSPLSAHPHLPKFSGTFSTEEADRRLAADDFGHYLHRLPSAVLSPSSPEDIIRVVQFAHQNGLKIAPRGQGHSTHGQAQVEGGIVVDLTSLSTITTIHADRVEVEAGALWSTLLQATLTQGLTPPVLTDYLNLSIGGVLAVGGIGGTSYRYGAIVDNVLELQVVTGTGKLETCSPTHQPELFENVLAGLGQCGIIVKVTLRLIPAQTHARVFHLFYPHLAALLHDERLLLNDERFDYIVGHIVPTPAGTWDYVLEVVSFYTPPTQQPDNAQLLQGLGFIPGTEQVEDKSYFTFSNRVIKTVDALTAMGIWHHPHPWFNVFVPDSQLEQYVSEALSEISPADLGFFPIILSGLHSKHFHTPLLRTPTEETFFSFAILRTVAPDPNTVAKAVAHNRRLFERGQALGGTCYPIGSLEFSPTDWKRQFGSRWETLRRAKEQFDPDGVLTPGQGIFSAQ
jgi:cytokinin dehydrogenase